MSNKARMAILITALTMIAVGGGGLLALIVCL